MVTYHNRVPRPAEPIAAFRSGRIDFDILMAQAGSTTVRLLIFRPGTTTAERVKVSVYSWLVARGMWPVVTIIAAVFTPEFIRSGGLGWCIGFGVFVTAALVVAAWLLARPTLADAHGIRVGVRASRRGPQVSGDMDLLEEYANRLIALESADLSPVDHEAEWARLYDDLSTITNRAGSNS
jgi:hypothetical protein